MAIKEQKFGEFVVYDYNMIPQQEVSFSPPATAAYALDWARKQGICGPMVLPLFLNYASYLAYLTRLQQQARAAFHQQEEDKEL